MKLLRLTIMHPGAETARSVRGWGLASVMGY